METKNDVMHAMNKLYFEALLVEEEDHDFEYIRKS